MSGAFATNPTPVLTAKDPYDVSVWTFDFTNTLGPNDTVALIAGVSCNPTGLGIGASAIVNGVGGASKAVSALLSNGVIGVKYLVTCDILTTNGNDYSRSFILPVQKR